ncbi:MAG: single-stranded-DNA-specific exonuclease RecJ, partial [Oscillospiraceae bacterium]
VAAKLVDYRKSGLSQAKYFAARDAYEGYMRGEGVPEPLRPRIIPSREELVAVYKAVKKVPTAIDNIFMSLVSDSMNYCKMRLCLDIFSELKLVHIDHNQETASLVPTTQKVDLESSIILKELRG